MTSRSNSETKRIALMIIRCNSKIYLANKIGITRMTLDVRLKKDNWKLGEIAIIDTLGEVIEKKLKEL